MSTRASKVIHQNLETYHNAASRNSAEGLTAMYERVFSKVETPAYKVTQTNVDGKIDFTISAAGSEITVSELIAQLYGGNFKFVEGDSFHANALDNTITFPPELINRPYFLIALFHEFGHTTFYQKVTILQKLGDPESTPAHLTAATERNAWATCLVMLRELTKRGILAYSNYKSLHELLKSINLSLADYELVRIAKLLAEGKGNEADLLLRGELEGIFL